MKKNGVVYTPENIVNLLLKEVDYNGKKILKKHVMENSCGDGAFLIKIVEKYCEEFLLTNSDIDKLVLELEKYIHGIEIDKIEVEKTKKTEQKDNPYGLTENTVIGEIVDKYPYIKEFMPTLSPTYKKLMDPVQYMIMSKVATLDMIAMRGGFPVEEIIEKLSDKIRAEENK